MTSHCSWKRGVRPRSFLEIFITRTFKVWLPLLNALALKLRLSPEILVPIQLGNDILLVTWLVVNFTNGGRTKTPHHRKDVQFRCRWQWRSTARSCGSRNCMSMSRKRRTTGLPRRSYPTRRRRK